MISPAHAAEADWKAAFDRAILRWERASLAHSEATQNAQILEEKLKEQEKQATLLQARLASLDKQLSELSVPPPQSQAVSPEDEARLQQRQDELIATSLDRVVILTGKQGAIGAGFLSQQGEETRVYASAALVSANPEILVETLDGSKLPTSKDLSCPDGVDLACLHPTDATRLSRFEITAANEPPDVGDQVVIVIVNRETRKLSGIRGTIRGAGPDNWELDANLLPDMSGAPVLSLESGKVLGVVTPQVDGTTAEWAIGTRHQASRSFAARLDRIGKWQTLDLGRFAKEAEYVERINAKSRLAWAAHLLIEFEMAWRRIDVPARPLSTYPGKQEQEKYAEDLAKYKQEVREAQAHELKEPVSQFAKQHASQAAIQRAESWLADFRKTGDRLPSDDLETRLANLYRQLRTDLGEKDRDLSAHLTWYHSKQLQAALEWRREGLRVMAENGDRLGR